MSGILAGGIPAGIYPTDTLDQATFKAKHSGAAVVFVGDAGKFEQFEEACVNLPLVKAIVGWDCDQKCGKDITRPDGSVVKVYTWAKWPVHHIIAPFFSKMAPAIATRDASQHFQVLGVKHHVSNPE